MSTTGPDRRPPATPEENRIINELMRVVRSYTHVISTQKKGYPEYGSAVMLRSGTRLFAFTAAHNIHNTTTIQFPTSPSSGRRSFSVLDTYTHPEYDREPFSEMLKFDLAILELEPNPEVQAGDISQIHQLNGGFRPVSAEETDLIGGPFVWIVGFPVDIATRRNDVDILYKTTICTQILDGSVDELSLAYPAEMYQTPPDGLTGHLGPTPTTPTGFSGGGVWAVSNPLGMMFNPYSHIRLVGIQSHWSRTQRLVRCVPGNVIVDSLMLFRPELF